MELARRCYSQIHSSTSRSTRQIQNQPETAIRSATIQSLQDNKFMADITHYVIYSDIHTNRSTYTSKDHRLLFGRNSISWAYSYDIYQYITYELMPRVGSYSSLEHLFIK